MKHIATNLNKSLSGLDAPHVWDIELAFDSLKSAGLAETKRTAERRINALGFLPPLLTPDRIADETGEPANRLVLEWRLEQARKRRDRVLFVQLHALPDGKPCLHANDARDARFWVPLTDPSPAIVISALTRLQQHIGKAVALFPHGALTAILRDAHLPDALSLDLHAYPSVMPELDRALTKDRGQYQPTSHLRRLEAESIDIIREAVAEARHPVMLYSIGKDSGVMLHLAKKAFYPSLPPFPLLHVDTRWKFRDMYRFRDAMARHSGMELVVHINPEAVTKDINPFDHGSSLHTDITKTEGLKQALDAHGFDVIFGGARRDEEKSRAKERIFSFRTRNHRWDPKNQRPELWSLYNTRKNPGESMRVFPLSNWTELDIWQYILQEQFPVVPLYFAKPRPVIVRPDMIMLVDDARCRMAEGETITMKTVRFRTLGCYPLTGAVESGATSVEDIVLELINARQSERQGRKIDTDSAGSMEKKKQEGYF